MVFLIILALALGGSLTFFLILVGLFEAPWPLLLAGLLLAFFSLQRLSVESEPEALNPEPAQSALTAKPNQPKKFQQRSAIAPASQPRSKGQRMGEELVYRGIRYTHVEPTDTPAPGSVTLEGTYRGHHWKAQKPPQPATQPDIDISDEIVYRGHKVKKSNSQSA